MRLMASLIRPDLEAKGRQTTRLRALTPGYNSSRVAGSNDQTLGTSGHHPKLNLIHALTDLADGVWDAKPVGLAIFSWRGVRDFTH